MVDMRNDAEISNILHVYTPDSLLKYKPNIKGKRKGRIAILPGILSRTGYPAP
jgi:hypothetical protein